MAAPLTLAVAEMQPAPPARSVCRRKVSLPAKTSKPRAPNASITAFVLFQSPELSLMPATTPGYAASSRSINGSEMPTCATGGMW